MIQIKNFTKNSRIFTFSAFSYSLVFFPTLGWLLENELWNYASLSGVTYGLLIFVTGFMLSSKDSIRKSRSDLGLHYMAGSFIGTVPVGLVWTAIARPESFTKTLLETGLATISILIIYLLSRRTIKGMSKEEIFK